MFLSPRSTDGPHNVVDEALAIFQLITTIGRAGLEDAGSSACPQLCILDRARLIFSNSIYVTLVLVAWGRQVIVTVEQQGGHRDTCSCLPAYPLMITKRSQPAHSAITPSG